MYGFLLRRGRLGKLHPHLVQVMLPFLHRSGALLFTERVGFCARLPQSAFIFGESFTDTGQDFLGLSQTTASPFLARFQNKIDRFEKRGIEHVDHHQDDQNVQQQRAIGHKLN